MQAEGTCWLGGTTGTAATRVRFSTTNWSTTAADIDRSAAAIVGAYRASLEATARAASTN